MQASVTTSPLLAGLRSVAIDPQDWETLNRCPICQRSDYLRDTAVVDRGSIATVCLDCEYGFLRRRPVRAWYERFYSKEWDRDGQGRVGRRAAKRPKVNTRAADFCAGHLMPGSTVLDVGAGFGSILLAFQARGFKVRGIERSEHRAAYLQDVLGIASSRSPIESFTPSGEIHLMCMNHVLEHVSDPAEAIATMAAMLPEGGMIYIAVPDFWRGEYPPQTFHFVPHLSSFTVKSLSRLLTGHGLHVVKTHGEKDIQVLAIKAGAAAADNDLKSDSASRAAFWDKTSAAVLDGFGTRAGHHMLVWFEDDGQEMWTYQRRVFSAPRFLSLPLKMAILGEAAVERALPKTSRRVVQRILRPRLPAFVTSGRTRMLTVRVSGDMTLPVHITHPPQQAPVWIK